MAALIWATLLLAAFTTADALGNKVIIQEHPYMVQVEIGARFLWTQQCAGTVLTSYHILSAASCFLGPIEYRRCRAGSARRRGDDGLLVTIAYATNNPNADISVVRLGLQLPFSDKIAQGSIFVQGSQIPAGLGVQAVGWGIIAQGGSGISNNDLYRASMVITNNNACAALYAGEKDVTADYICFAKVGGSGRDYDDRDLGAAVVYQGNVIGVISGGRRGAYDQYPVVATKISSFTNWIIENAQL